MKKYLMTLFLVFACLLYFQVDKLAFYENINNESTSNSLTQQNIEEDGLVAEIDQCINHPYFLPLSISECRTSIKRALDIWKPPVNA